MNLPPRSDVDHTPGRAQRWPEIDGDLRAWIDEVAAVFDLLDGLVGIYLHGSCATTGMYRPKSDVDVLVVVTGSLSGDERWQLGHALVELHDRRPLTGALELSVVTAGAAARAAHPMPFEFHIGEPVIDEFRGGGTGPLGNDADLAAHVTVARSRGIALRGPAPGDVFGNVPRVDYVDAILGDLDWIVGGGIVDSPFYGVLNICRCAHELLGSPSSPPSKEESAGWALDHLPVEHHAVVADALGCYRASGSTPPALRRNHGHTWDDAALLAFAAWATTTLVA